MRFSFWLGLLLCAASWVQAQSSIFDIPESQQLSFVDLGIAAVSREVYVGAGKSETSVLPYVNGQYKGRYFVNPGLGIGAYAIRKDKFRLAGSVHYNLGRDGEDTPLNGEAFDLDGGFTAKLSTRLYTPISAIDVIGSVPLNGDLEGYRIDTLMSTEFYLFDRALRITPGVRATFHSGKYLDALYGISDAQLAALSLPLDSPITATSFDSEASTLGAHAVAYYDVNDAIQLVGIVNYSRLIGDVKDTALAPDKDGITAAVAIARKF